MGVSSNRDLSDEDGETVREATGHERQDISKWIRKGGCRREGRWRGEEKETDATQGAGTAGREERVMAMDSHEAVTRDEDGRQPARRETEGTRSKGRRTCSRSSA
eukprot:jgi/Antlo1/538/42